MNAAVRVRTPLANPNQMRYITLMKTILTAILSLALLAPVSAGPHRGGHDGGRGGHWRYEHHEGHRFHGDHFHFRGGYFYGEVIILDDGCWMWNGYQWIYFDQCD